MVIVHCKVNLMMYICRGKLPHGYKCKRLARLYFSNTRI